MLLFHILSSLEIAVSISVQISAMLVPTFDRAAPKKLETSTSASPSMMILALLLLVRFKIILDFCVVLHSMCDGSFNANTDAKGINALGSTE